MKTIFIVLDALLVITLGLMIWQNYHLRAQILHYAGEIHQQYEDKAACEHELSLERQSRFVCPEDPQGK